MYRQQGEDYRQKYQRAFQSISTTDKEVIRNFEVAKEAILNLAKLKIAASSCSIAASIFNGLKLEGQKYLDYYRSSHLLLSEIQADFLAQIVGKENCVLIEAWGSYKEADLWRERVEKKLGRSLPTWGRIKCEGVKEISASQVKDALREELTPIAEEICLNTYNRLKKEFA